MVTAKAVSIGFEPSSACEAWRELPSSGDPGPDDAGRDEVHGSVGRLADHNAVGERPGEARGERAVSAAFLLDHALVDKWARELAGAQRGLDGEEHGRDPALHVAGPPAVQPPVLDHGSVGRLRPAVGGLFADDVDVPIQEERLSATASQRADETATTLVRQKRDPRVRDLRKIGLVRHERADVEAEVSQALLDERLRRLLVAEKARHPDEVLQEGDRLGQRELDRLPRLQG